MSSALRVPASSNEAARSRFTFMLSGWRVVMLLLPMLPAGELMVVALTATHDRDATKGPAQPA